MSSIIIQHFGAIKECNTPIEIKKVTFFIGNLGQFFCCIFVPKIKPLQKI